MKKILLLISTIFLLIITGNAQDTTGVVKGLLMDTTGREPLANATVSILLNADSTLLSYVLSDKAGTFSIGNLMENSYKIQVSFQGYTPFEKDFSITSNHKTVDLGKIVMKKDYNTLDTFVAISYVPIQVKGDTVQFNADAFKTVPNATAEDLMKKLPGVEIDPDGNVKAQGEAVTKIYVDGKEFFGNDPKMATKNITADMIQSVQVYDDMSDQAKFTRIDDGSRTKTINIVLKKNRRKGYFGRGIAGAGDNERYQASVVANRFNDTRRISLVTNSNNINKQNFGNRNGGSVATAGGLNTATSLGLNYIDKIGTKVDITGNYRYSKTQNRREQTNYRESSFFNDSSATENSKSINTAITQNHNFNLRLEYYIDSLNSILYTPAVSFQQTDNGTHSNAYSTAITPLDKYLSNTRKSDYRNTSESNTITNEILYRRKFKKQGRTFTIGYSNTIDKSNGHGTNISPIVFYNRDGSVISSIDQNFKNDQDAGGHANVITGSYTEMFRKHHVLELNYAYTNRHSTSNRDAYDYNAVSKEFDLVNKQQTNYFENDFIAHRYGGNYRYLQTKYSFQVGTSVQSSLLDNQSIRGIYQTNGKDSVIYTKQRATNLFPTANFTYNFSKKTNVSIHYRGRTNQPTVAQLQDVPDLTNLLRIRIGNSGLHQEFGHNLDLSFKTLDTKTYKYLNATINASKVSNRIVNSTDSLTLSGLHNLGLADSLLRPGVQLIRPINLNGAYNLSYNITVGIPFKKMKGSSVNFSNSYNYGRSLSMLYKRLNVTNSFTLSQSAGVNLDIKEKFNFGLRARFSYTQAKYSITQSKANTHYYTQSYSTDINYYVTKTLILSTDFDYLLYTGQSEGFNRSIPLWNANLAKQFFKKRNGELKFSVNDLLNQNQNITRTQGENYYYDSRTVVLQRYFLLTFTYSLNRFGGRGPQSAAPGGGMRGGGGNNNRGGRGTNVQSDF